MIVDHNLRQYVVSANETIAGAVRHVVNCRGRVAIVLAENGVFQGLLTNGDILRWLSNEPSVNPDQPVVSILRDNYLVARPGTSPRQMEESLKRVRFLPILDDRGRLTGIARERKQDEGIRIDSHIVNRDSPVFVIAEIGINHNGNFDLAMQLVDEAAKTGADCAKFQMRDLASLYVNAGDAADPSQNLGAQYALDLLNRFQLSNQQMFQLFDRCKSLGMTPLCTPWDSVSLQALEDYGMSAYKVASADLTNHRLLAEVSRTGKPLICSTGMSTEAEIITAIELLNSEGACYILLHCNSTYPAPYKDINLQYMSRLRELGQCPVGYSGHERGSHVVVAAVALGAKLVEKHFTLDRSLEGNDHKVSLLPAEFSEMVQQIRDTESALGTTDERRVTQGEMMNRVTLAKSIVATCEIPSGTVVDETMIGIKSPGRGLQPNRLNELVGTQLRRSVKPNDCFFLSDLACESVAARNYKFRRPWGIPVRYHDFAAILRQSNPDFLEFHLSYRDMDEDPSRFLNQTYGTDLVVHSPDTFAGDHLLNLCDDDPSHRQRSIQELQRVVNITRELTPYFSQASRPLVVASVGGYTRHGHIPTKERKRLYDCLLDSLSHVDSDGVEIIPQTLPPFPWYFGGQQYLNLFMDASDSAEFCRSTGYRVCLDVCHSRLACNHFGWSFRDFIDTLGPHAAHLHICDAAGVDGEGLQIGDGDIDFPALAADLDRVAPAATFLPEVWQGHENNGEGFWIALDRMEGIF